MSHMQCQKCNKNIRLRAEFYGRKIKCTCGQIMVIPSQPAVVEAEVFDAEIVSPHAPRQSVSSLPTPQMGSNDSSLQTETSRTYRHRACGQDTTVSEFNHIYVTHVFSHPEETYCSVCDATFMVDDFCWSNTGESLRDYYTRYQNMFSGSDKLILDGLFTIAVTIVGGLIGFVVGAVIARLLGLPLGFILAIGSAVVCGLISVKILGRMHDSICQRVLGTKEYHKLR